MSCLGLRQLGACISINAPDGMGLASGRMNEQGGMQMSDFRLRLHNGSPGWTEL